MWDICGRRLPHQPEHQPRGSVVRGELGPERKQQSRLLGSSLSPGHVGIELVKGGGASLLSFSGPGSMSLMRNVIPSHVFSLPFAATIGGHLAIYVQLSTLTLQPFRKKAKSFSLVWNTDACQVTQTSIFICLNSRKCLIFRLRPDSPALRFPLKFNIPG